MHYTKRIITLIVAFVLVISNFTYGQNYYLDVPDIEGDVTEADYKDQICITSFSWNVMRDETISGGGGSTSAAESAEFKFGKSFDSASPSLFGVAANGKAFDELTFTVVAPNGDGGQYELAVYVLNNVVFTGYQPGGESGSPPKEVISLLARNVRITHFSLRPDGSVGDERTFEWNFRTNSGG